MSGIDFMTIARWVGHKDGGILIGNVTDLSNEHAQEQAVRFNFGRPSCRATSRDSLSQARTATVGTWGNLASPASLRRRQDIFVLMGVQSPRMTVFAPNHPPSVSILLVFEAQG